MQSNAKLASSGLARCKRMVHADDWSSFDQRGPHLQGQMGSGACSSQRRADASMSKQEHVERVKMCQACWAFVQPVTDHHWISPYALRLRSLRSLRIVGQEGQITKIELVTLFTENVDAGFCKAHMRISLGARAEFQYRFEARTG